MLPLDAKIDPTKLARILHILKTDRRPKECEPTRTMSSSNTPETLGIRGFVTAFNTGQTTIDALDVLGEPLFHSGAFLREFLGTLSRAHPNLVLGCTFSLPAAVATEPQLREEFLRFLGPNRAKPPSMEVATELSDADNGLVSLRLYPMVTSSLRGYRYAMPNSDHANNRDLIMCSLEAF